MTKGAQLLAAIGASPISLAAVVIMLIALAHLFPALVDLRCEIRERLVAFIRHTYPESLPRFRASICATAEHRVVPDEAWVAKH